MRVKNRRGRLALIMLGVLWAAVLTSAGVFLASMNTQLGGWAMNGWLIATSALRSGVALAAIAGGQFIFMALVADRLFPRASKRVVVLAELVALVAFVWGLAKVVVWLGGWGDGWVG